MGIAMFQGDVMVEVKNRRGHEGRNRKQVAAWMCAPVRNGMASTPAFDDEMVTGFCFGASHTTPKLQTAKAPSSPPRQRSVMR